MGQISHLIVIQRAAFAILLGFTFAGFFCLIFLSGRGKHSHYDGNGIQPVHDYADWVKEGSGQVPIFLKLWIAAIAAWCVAITAIVASHGYWY
ncbi:MAG: hypothetical protein ACRD1C_07990 [Terriglobales bacterium]